MTTPTYDRELIARMLETCESYNYPRRALVEQAALLRAADNADAAGVRTVNATGPVRAILAQLRHEVEQDKGWDYTEYERGRLEEKRRSIQLLEAALAQQPAPIAAAGAEWNDEAAWSLAARAEASGAERDSDDNGTWWTLRIEHFNAIAQQPAPPSAPVGAEGLVAKWRGLANDALRRSGTWNGNDIADRIEFMADELEALAQQPEAPAQEAVAGDQVADIVGRWMDKQLTADTAMAAIKSHLDNCYMQPANDYNRGWVAGANSVTERAAELVAAARAAPQPAIPEVGGWKLEADERGVWAVTHKGRVCPTGRLKVWVGYATTTQEPDHG